MITIECLNCHNSIAFDEKKLQQIKCCPFCMIPLHEEAAFNEIDSFGKAFYHAVKKGKDQQINARAIRGILLDETPKCFEKELNKFGKIIGDKYFSGVIDAFVLDVETADRELNKLEKTLAEVEMLNEKAISEVVGYCREAVRYFHGINIDVKLNYVVLDQEDKPQAEKKSESTKLIEKILQEAHKYFKGFGGTQKDENMAFQLYQKAAELGNAEAQYWQGFMLFDGKVVEKDYVKSFELFRKSAEQGYESAQFMLGLCYETGKGVLRDDAKTFEWYQKAAEKGFVAAQCKLGEFYDKGIGVNPDYVKASEWYRKAAEQGHISSACALAEMYLMGKGVAKDEFSAFRWYQKAADQGYAEAQYRLGLMYEIFNHDLPKACVWYRKAAAQGDADAIQKLKELGMMK